MPGHMFNGPGFERKHTFDIVDGTLRIATKVRLAGAATSHHMQLNSLEPEHALAENPYKRHSENRMPLSRAMSPN